ncbi:MULTISPECIES: type II toxin-antitoxin system RelE/ParE family toxin [unclassified Nitrospina]|uniref:type II toxin-antitoxin system RelE/ParE family toxin n=1 Tax=unclassified Nitrospina TaxID=2638683 RepID=UPI003F9AAB16
MDLKRVPAVFFKTEQGTEPVRDWLLSLGKADRTAVGADIKTVEYGWPIGMPACRPLGQGLWEVRTRLENRIARVIFCIHEERMVLLHGFIKKSQKTPKPDKDLALKRRRELEAHE